MGTTGSDRASGKQIQAEAEDALEAAISWADVADGSLLDGLRMSMGYVPFLGDHFQAATLAELVVDYSQANTDGTTTLGPTGQPSIIEFDTGGVANQKESLQSDQLFSLADYPGATKLVLEVKAKVSHETSINFRLRAVGVNATTEYWGAWLDTGTAAIDTGGLQTRSGGTVTNTETDLVGTFDLTAFRVFRLELTPGNQVELFVDGVSQGSVSDASVPDDEAYRFDAFVETLTGSSRILDVDYWKVWGE